ncbi:MAG: MBL fold metallo-hydrolase [Candidatus Aminicenantes bacterium]|nr:MBL fold metallo-hydrolase [Candidatus Aminicenantes bacterium]
MNKFMFFSICILILCVLGLTADQDFDHDVIQTSKGELKMTFIAHGTLMFEFNELVIHIDPVGRYADYSRLPKADLVLITHHHGDHLDPKVLNTISDQDTELVLTEKCKEQYKNGMVMNNGDKKVVKGIKIKAIPAYNIQHMRSGNTPFHPKGEGNGYILELGSKKVYVAGDTENTPEMKALTDIDIAFLPMNIPYTMTPEMAADAARSFMPKILYPYHYGNTDPQKLVDLLKDMKEIEVRVRDLR